MLGFDRDKVLYRVILFGKEVRFGVEGVEFLWFFVILGDFLVVLGLVFVFVLGFVR